MPAASAKVVLPGETIGLVGSGQLGRMFVMAARRMGYRVAVLAPNPKDPAALLANEIIVGAYDDLAAYEKLAAISQVVTYEFENVNAEALKKIQNQVPVYPDPALLVNVQDRALEKQLLSSGDYPVGRFAIANSLSELEESLAAVDFPVVVKTARSGYDGKGQLKLEASVEARQVWQQLGRVPVVVEEWLQLEKEISVLVARDQAGGLATYGPLENQHRNHILDITSCPAAVDEKLAVNATEIARRFADEVKLIGIVCLEFFVDKDNRLLVNEIAPRPHNSGHLTIESFSTSQFEQQVRTICGLPVAEAKPLGAAAMANLLGDIWSAGQPNWHDCLQNPKVHLHLYDKADPKPGRKMGHLTVLAESVELAITNVSEARASLQSKK